MKKTLKGLAFAAMLALTLLASTTNAFAKDMNTGRETAWTAWTDPGSVQGPQGVTPDGVTWEE